MGTFAIPDDASTTLDDGSTVVGYGGAGDVIIVDRNGKLAPPDNSIVNDFLRNVSGGIGDAIRNAFAPRPPVALPAVQPGQSIQAQQTRQMLLVGGAVLGGILLYRALK